MDTTNNMKKKDLVVTRVFDAPVELVWKCWTDSELVMRWSGPNGFTCPIAKLDFREGGTSLVCMREPKEFGGKDMYSIWFYKKIMPMKLIEITSNLSDKDGKALDPVTLGLPPEFTKDIRMVVTFKKVGSDKTEMTVTQYDWTVSQMSDMAEAGWNQSLDKMQLIFIKA